jgi:hypothetical protein
MTVADVVAELERFEQLCRAHGAANVEHLREGIDPWRIRSLEVEHGIRLPEDAKAVWLWHDGVDLQHRFSEPFWGHAYYFLDLKSAILEARMQLNIRNSGDVARRPGSSWVALGQATVSTVIDVTEPHPTEGSPVLISDATASIEEYPIVTLSERIRIWNSAIENDIWYLDDDRRWRRREDRAMGWPDRALL